MVHLNDYHEKDDFLPDLLERLQEPDELNELEKALLTLCVQMRHIDSHSNILKVLKKINNIAPNTILFCIKILGWTNPQRVRTVIVHLVVQGTECDELFDIIVPELEKSIQNVKIPFDVHLVKYNKTITVQITDKYIDLQDGGMTVHYGCGNGTNASIKSPWVHGIKNKSDYLSLLVKQNLK